MSLRIATALLIAGLAVSPVASLAQDGRSWQAERFDVVIRDQPLSDVIREFGVLVDVPVFVSDAVDGRVSIRFNGATGAEILDGLARENSLDWRYDGVRIEVSAHEEQVSRLLDTGGVLRDDLIAALRAISVYQDKFPISGVDGSIALIVGPPRYVAIAEVVLAELVEKRQREAQEEELRAARLAAAAQLEEERRAEALRRREERAERERDQAFKLAAAREEMRLRAAERAAIARERELARLRELANRGPVVVRGLSTGG